MVALFIVTSLRVANLKKPIEIYESLSVLWKTQGGAPALKRAPGSSPGSPWFNYSPAKISDYFTS
jgi:hypothetical protein